MSHKCFIFKSFHLKIIYFEPYDMFKMQGLQKLNSNNI